MSRVLRDFKSAFAPKFLIDLQVGVMNYKYRGIDCLKCPLDLAIYDRLIWDLRPRTVIEIGTYRGGGSLWLADSAMKFGLDCRVISIDASPQYRVANDSRIEFLTGDVHDLGLCLSGPLLAELAHPWLVIEDSAHTFAASLSALEFFTPRMSRGDYIVIEDGILDELGMAQQFNGGPNRAIAEFLSRNDDLELVTSYTDMFGVNATYNLNGYLRRC